MSVVTLQLGQCGNQIGTELFSLLSKDASCPAKFTSPGNAENVEYKELTFSRYFSEMESGVPAAKAVMVDMEPKVISNCKTAARKSGTWTFPDGMEYIQKQGSGNNWALGYHGYGQEVSDAVMELTRKECERCDCVSGFLVLMSLAGGTGSGLGTRLTYSLKDCFEDCLIVNHLIWPYMSGEIILQNYNAVLTLSHLQQCSDLMLGQQNAQVHDICAKLLGMKNVSMESLNKVVAHKLASVLQPAYSKTDFHFANVLYELSSSLALHPSYRMVAMKSIPHIPENSMEFSMYMWAGLMKHLRQMLIADSVLEEGVNWEIKLPVQSTRDVGASDTKSVPNEIRAPENICKSLSNLLILRGKDVSIADTSGFKNRLLYSSVVSTEYVYHEWNQMRCFNQYDKCATLLTNSQSFLRPLNMMTSKAWSMFGARAYVHQYQKYGLQLDDFVDSFGVVEQIIHDYANL